MERLTLQDGTQLEGLIDHESDDSIEFTEIVIPAGRPMHLVVRPVPRERVANIKRLTSAERTALATRIVSFRRRARIEAGEARRIPLDADLTGDPPGFRYRGRWFDLYSTLDEPLTRRVVVRLEQLFRAFRQVLPATDAAPRRTLQIRVCGRSDEYATLLRDERISLGHEAFYHRGRHRIVVSSNLRQLTHDVQSATRAHQEELEQLKIRDRDSVPLLKRQLEQWTAEGFTPQQCDQLRTAVVKRWRMESEDLKREIRAAQRQNQEILEQAERQLFARLFHEATHAYLEGQLYHGEQFGIPRWLNEGLAQIFETAILEGAQLRVDAPASQLLTQLKSDLASQPRLPIRELLAADDGAFLVPHRRQSTASDRHYLYAWGLSYFLLFEMPGSLSERLDQLVARNAAADPAERFSTVTQQSVEAFEARWRQEMLRLKPP